MDITITIHAPELAAAISKLADAIASKTNIAIPSTPSTTPTPITTVQPAIPHYETFSPTPAPAPTSTGTTAAAAPAPTTGDTPPWELAPQPAPAPERQSTAVDPAYRNKVATAAARLIDQNKMAEVLKALEECGAQAVTQLDANSMPLFVQKITALGAVI